MEAESKHDVGGEERKVGLVRISAEAYEFLTEEWKQAIWRLYHDPWGATGIVSMRHLSVEEMVVTMKARYELLKKVGLNLGRDLDAIAGQLATAEEVARFAWLLALAAETP